MCITLSLNAQTQEECSTEDSYLNDFNINYSKSTNANEFLTDEPIVLNIYFWGINRDDGSSANPLTELKVLESIARINKAFNQYNIYFKLL